MAKVRTRSRARRAAPATATSTEHAHDTTPRRVTESETASAGSRRRRQPPAAEGHSATMPGHGSHAFVCGYFNNAHATPFLAMPGHAACGSTVYSRDLGT